MTDETDASSSPLAGWWPPSRRGWIALGVLVFLLVVRIALPTIAERVIESQGSELLAGEVTVENVDLWLLRGAVALEGVALWPEGGAPEEDRPPAEPALVAWDRVYVNVSWLALVQKVAEIEDFELDGLGVNVARLHDGSLVLPELRDPAVAEEPAESEEPGSPFGVVIDRAAVSGARVLVRDDVPTPPSVRELELPSLVVTDLAINHEEPTAPGKIVVRAELGRGTIRVEARVSERAGGFETETRIDVKGLPLDQMHVHEPLLGWTRSAGSVDASVRVRVDRDARIIASGRAAVSDLAIAVPDEEKPGLAWRQLEIEIDRIDVAKQTAKLDRVSLDGARVLVRPDAVPPLPIIPTALVTPGDGTSRDGGSRPDGDETEPGGKTPSGDAPAAKTPGDEPPDEETPREETPDEEPVGGEPPGEEPESAESGDAPPDWAVELALLEVTDAAAHLLLDGRPARASLGGLRVAEIEAAGAAWKIASIEIEDSGAEATFDGQTARANVGALSITSLSGQGPDFALGPVELADTVAEAELHTGNARVEIPRSTVTGVTSDPTKPIHLVATVKEHASVVELDATLVQQSRDVDARIDIENLLLGRYADLSGMSPVLLPTGTLQAALAIQVHDGDTAHVAGQIAIDELQVRTQDGEDDFSVAWQALAVDIRTLDLSLENPDEPMNLELAELRLDRPDIRATLTKDGIVLPTVRTAEVSADTSADAGTSVSAPEPARADTGSPTELAPSAPAPTASTETPPPPADAEAPATEAAAMPADAKTPATDTATSPNDVEAPASETATSPDDAEAPASETAPSPGAAEAPATETATSPDHAEAPATETGTSPDETEAPPAPTTGSRTSAEAPPTAPANSPNETGASPPATAASPAAAETPPAETAASPAAAEAPAAETAASADDTETASGPEQVAVQDGLTVQTESVGVDEIAELAEPAANLPLGFAIDRLRITDGTFRVVDRAVRPTYRGTITDFQLDIAGLALAHDASPADAEFEKMSLDLRAPGDAPVKIRAESEAKGIRIDANVEKLRLAQFNPYVQQASGYTILEGAATVESSVLWAKERYESDTDVTLRELDVGNDKGGTLFRDTFGISIGAALALIRDVTGKIGLGIPVSGSLEEGADVGIGSVVGQAITKAILGAITSPLKILGAITMVGGKVADIRPKPVPFRPGTSTIAKSALVQVDEIGDVLAASPAVKIELIGQAGPDDVRGLRERAVLAELQEESGFVRGLRNLVGAGRDSIQSALESGDTSALGPEDRARLDELAAEHEVTDDQLVALARERATALRERLVEGDGVPEDQLSIGEPRASRDEGASQVAVNLLARG